MPPITLSQKWARHYRWIFFLIAGALIGQLLLAFLLPIIVITRSSSGDSSSSLLSTAAAAAGNKRTNIPIPTSSPSPLPPPVDLLAFNDDDGTSHIGAGGNCTIASKEAISAIQRARTAACKEHIANVTCAHQAGAFYPRALPNSCPNGSFIANRALGCFRDAKHARLLDGYYTNFKQLNTPGKCIQLCLQSGFLYAGVQYGSECFCGNLEPPAAAKLVDGAECSYACVGEPEQTCGGYFAMNVYETGISS